MSRRLTQRFGVLAVLGLLGLHTAVLTSSPIASAASLTVDESCTLADAIAAANTDTAVGACPAGSGPDTITLAVDVSLTEPLPRVYETTLTIDGAGHTIERAEAAPEFRLFEVVFSQLNLNDVTLANGAVDRVVSGEAGGGAAIHAAFAGISITDSTIRNNSGRFGAAIAVLDAGVTVTRSTITANDAADEGGGIHVRTTGSGGSLSITDSTFSGNKGGAIKAGGDTAVNIINSTISGNTGNGLTLYDVNGTIRHTTIADNTGSGVWVPPRDTSGDPDYEVPGRPTLVGVLLDNPIGSDCGPLSLPLKSGGHNLATGPDTCGLEAPTDLIGATADLGPLHDNGGPTATHAVGTASDAVDAVPATDCTVAADQRGTARPQGGGCDIGAYEADDAPVDTLVWNQVGGDIDGEVRGDESGRAVAMSGDGSTVVVGAASDGNGSQSGHARIFRFDGATWVQVGGDIDGEGANDWSGQAVELSSDGETVVIGARNGARVFRIGSGVWSQVGEDIVGYGSSVAMSSDGSTVAIVSWGHTRAYRFDGIVWAPVGGDIPNDTGNGFEDLAMSSDGDTVIIGSPISGDSDRSGISSGHSSVYRFDGTEWLQLGGDIGAEDAGDESGDSVAMSGDGNTVIIGAPYNDGTGNRAGHARVFHFDGSAWVQVGPDIDAEAVDDHSGESVGMSSDGNTVIVGARLNDGNGANAGHARVFHFDGAQWIQIEGDIDGEARGDRSGSAVAMSSDGHTIVIGARGNDGNGNESGHARVYNLGIPAEAPVLVCGDVAGTADELAAAGYNVVVGSDGADFLPGTPGNDFMLGLDGKDVILAGTGDDVVCAGGSHDTVVGGGGADQLHAEAGNDRVWGGVGDDVITGGAGKDLLLGGNGDDVVSGNGADDTIRGGYDNDVLRGGSGKDDIRGDSGDDLLFGDAHDDVLRGHEGIDVCDGGGEVRGDQAFSCETVIGIP